MKILGTLQKTKWFGNAVYKLKDGVVLAAGRPVPQNDEPRLRGGVAILLCSRLLVCGKLMENNGRDGAQGS